VAATKKTVVFKIRRIFGVSGGFLMGKGEGIRGLKNKKRG